MQELFLLDAHRAAGALEGSDEGRPFVRHYGDPASEYGAAVGASAMADASDLGRLRVSGRAPGSMLNGILTNRLPGPASTAEGGIRRIESTPSALLTPKGRIVSEMRVVREDGGAAERYLLLLPFEGTAPAREHFARVLPPRLARVEPVDGTTGLLTILGPEAPAWLAREALGLRADPADLSGLPEGSGLALGGDGEAILVLRNGSLATPAWDVLADRATIRALWNRGVATGIRPVGRSVLETLRVEAGRPSLGMDLDEATIPTEAGMDTRMVDHGKGCYTGQEVIVRIRDRGHVNRHLRGVVLGDGPAAAPGAELFVAGRERSVGRLTSVADSPRAGGGLALAWVRREVEVPGEVRLGSPEGPPVAVRPLPTGFAPAGLSPLSWAF